MKQVDDCTMGGPLFVTFSGIYMVKIENYVVIPLKPIFYRRFIHDLYSRQKIGDNVLFDRLNNYHPNIKLTIEVNSSKFLPINSTFIERTQNYLHRRPPKLQNAINEIQSMVIFIVQKEYHQTLTKKYL